jgi:hypothetical protein
VPVSGEQTYSVDGQVVEGKLFDSKVTVTGDNVTILNCRSVGGGVNVIGFNILGSNVTLEGVEVAAAAGTSWYIGVQILDGAAGTIVRGCNLSGGENNLTNYGIGSLAADSYIHDASADGKTGAHADNVEVYGGSMTFDRCNLPMGPLKEDASINVAPFGNRSVTLMRVVDSVLDGGQAHILAGGDANDSVTNIQVLRNDMGGHTNPDTAGSFGIYMPCSFWQAHGLAETQAEQDASGGAKILWPSMGPDVNRWAGCSDLSPDKTGQIAVPR